MKILLLPSWYPTDDYPMNGSFFREQAHMLKRAGHDVSILVLTGSHVRTWPSQRQITSVIEDGIRVTRAVVPTFPPGMRRMERAAINALVMQAWKKHAIDIPDIIHAHSVFPAVLGAHHLSSMINVPFVLTEHRPVSLEADTHDFRYEAIRTAVRAAKVRMTVSTPFAELLGDFYDTPTFDISYLPVPQAFFDTPLRDRKPSDPFIFTHISHLAPGKRVEMTIRAFSKLDPSLNAHLTIVGGQPEAVNKLAQVVGELGVQDRVTLTGNIDRDQLPTYMADTDCFVLASEKEAGGTVLSEARASGVRTIATQTWAGRHHVSATHGVTIPIDDEQALTDAMNVAARGELEQTTLSAAEIRQAARDHVSEEAFVAHEIGAYQEAIDSWNRTSMVYHAPYPMDTSSSSASRVRPDRMLRAFEPDFDVIEMTGFPHQRLTQFKVLQRRLKQGTHVGFAYSESSTQPTLMATSVKKGIRPFLEPRIFRYLQKHQIPTGQFYRDIYWKFPEQLTNVPALRRRVMKALYEIDLWVLDKTGVYLFLPTDEMSAYLPAFQGRTGALPPGATLRESRDPDTIHLFYVGGVGDHYRMHEMVKGVTAVPGVHLTMCVPEAQWDKVKAEYEPDMCSRISIVHANSRELQQYYDQASAAMIYVEPGDYRGFAAPMKFYEALGYGKPVIASEGTHVARVVDDLGVGVSLPYDAGALASLLESWVAQPEILETYQERTRKARVNESWASRARRVVTTLMGAGRSV